MCAGRMDGSSYIAVVAAAAVVGCPCVVIVFVVAVVIAVLSGTCMCFPSYELLRHNT